MQERCESHGACDIVFQLLNLSYISREATISYNSAKHSESKNINLNMDSPIIGLYPLLP